MAGKGRPKTPLDVRFWQKVDKRGPDECWPWLGNVNTYSGYGRMFDGRIMTGAHRVAYIVQTGEIPPRMTVDHLCNNRLCMNGAHLRICTTQENTRAAKERRTTCRRGHPLAENTYISPNGAKRCRACNTERARDYNDQRARNFRVVSVGGARSATRLANLISQEGREVGIDTDLIALLTKRVVQRAYEEGFSLTWQA